MELANSVPKIGPERDAKLSAGFLQTQERVPTATAEVASSSRADVSLLRPQHRLRGNALLRRGQPVDRQPYGRQIHVHVTLRAIPCSAFHALC